jgi:hypothetical protein
LVVIRFDSIEKAEAYENSAAQADIGGGLGNNFLIRSGDSGYRNYHQSPTDLV